MGNSSYVGRMTGHALTAEDAPLTPALSPRNRVEREMENQATIGRAPAFRLLLRPGEKAGDEVVSFAVSALG